MLALSLGVAMSVLVNSVVNIALPTLSHELGVGASNAVWIVNAYQLAVAVALLPMAALGERIGHLKVYQAGMVVFMLASAACAAAPSFASLLPARALQGLGAASIMAVNTALLRAVYPKAQLGHGVGLNGMVVAVSAAAGPTLGGSVLAFAPWPWLFALFVPMAGLALVIGRRALVDAPRPAGIGGIGAIDVFGVLLQALAIVAFIVGVGHLGQKSWQPAAPALLAAALVVGTGFVRRELRSSHPMLPLDLLRQPLFALSFGASCCSFVAQMMALVALPFALQQMGFGPARSGWLMTPWPLAVMVIAPFAGALSERWSAHALGSVGLGLAGFALLLLTTLPADDASVSAIAWRVTLCGVGFGLFSAHNIRTLVAAAPLERSAAVGAMIAISRQSGQTLGAALAGVMLAQPGGAGGPWCFGVAATVTFVATALSLLRSGPRG